MSYALSVDLRERVAGAVAGGSSCRQAAIRFGVSASSAIRWWQMERTTGSVAPGPLGGDRRSARVYHGHDEPADLAMLRRGRGRAWSRRRS